MSEPVPERRPEPSGRRSGSRSGLVCALLCLAAAVLTMIGSFQDLAVIRQRADGFQERMNRIITVWDVTIVANGLTQTQDSVPVNGVPLLVSAVLLLAAALLRLPVTRRLHRVAGLVTVAGAAFLSALVLVVSLQAMWWLDVFGPVATAPASASTVVESAFGAGVWTLMAGAVLALAATVPTWRRPRPEPQRVEPDTPRLGTPLVVRLPDDPPAQPPPA